MSYKINLKMDIAQASKLTSESQDNRCFRFS